MSDLKKDDFDADYWFEMYQGQCATTDEWAKKYHDEVERKADATLLARCEELQRIAEVANAMVGKSRDQIESQAKRIAELEAERLRLAGEVANRNSRALEGDKAVKAFTDTCDYYDKRIAELEAERDALKVDAERYRWLVEEHASDGPSWHVRLPNNEVPGVDLSSLIDAAIKEQQ